MATFPGSRGEIIILCLYGQMMMDDGSPYDMLRSRMLYLISTNYTDNIQSCHNAIKQAFNVCNTRCHL